MYDRNSVKVNEFSGDPARISHTKSTERLVSGVVLAAQQGASMENGISVVVPGLLAESETTAVPVIL